MLCENNPGPDSPKLRDLIIAEPPIHVSGQVFDHHPGSTMNTNETEYSLEPTTSHPMQEAQDLANTLTEPALGHSASPKR